MNLQEILTSTDTYFDDDTIIYAEKNYENLFTLESEAKLSKKQNTDKKFCFFAMNLLALKNRYHYVAEEKDMFYSWAEWYIQERNDLFDKE